MEKERQFQLFRAVVKEMIREKGLKLTGNVAREAASEVQKLNERLKLNPPLKVSEFLETYLELGKELAEEHFNVIQAKITDETKKS